MLVERNSRAVPQEVRSQSAGVMSRFGACMARRPASAAPLYVGLASDQGDEMARYAELDVVRVSRTIQSWQPMQIFEAFRGVRVGAGQFIIATNLMYRHLGRVAPDSGYYSAVCRLSSSERRES